MTNKNYDEFLNHVSQIINGMIDRTLPEALGNDRQDLRDRIELIYELSSLLKSVRLYLDEQVQTDPDIGRKSSPNYSFCSDPNNSGSTDKSNASTPVRLTNPNTPRDSGFYMPKPLRARDSGYRTPIID